MVIDFHTHTFPDAIAAGAVASLSKKSRSRAFSDGTAAGLLVSMKEAGIHRSVVLPVATNPEKVGKMNERFAAGAPEGLVPFGCAHPATPWEEMALSLSRLAEAGVRGIKLHPVYQGAAFDEKETLRIVEKASELGLWTVVHAGLDIGFPGDERASLSHLAAGLSALGGGKVILAHMGAWRQWELVAEKIGPTGAMVDTSFSLGRIAYLPEAAGEDAELLSEEAFCALVRALGADRVLFGTDSPWTSQKNSVEEMDALPLDREEKEQILWKNALRVLGTKTQ